MMKSSPSTMLLKFRSETPLKEWPNLNLSLRLNKLTKRLGLIKAGIKILEDIG
jgi:hypothetical protein